MTPTKKGAAVEDICSRVGRRHEWTVPEDQMFKGQDKEYECTICGMRRTRAEMFELGE